MAHLNIDLPTHLLLALYPAAALFLIEIIGMYAKVLPYKRYMLQGIVSLVFVLLYVIVIEGTGIAIVLLLLAPVLFIQAKRVRENPTIR